IFQSRIPIISAVGHEIDLTIADLVADCRALTPSEAAELAVPDSQELLRQLDAGARHLRQLVRNRLNASLSRTQELTNHRVFRRPRDWLRMQTQRLDELNERLARAEKHRRDEAGRRLDQLAAKLQSLSPLNVLKRGYSLTRKLPEGGVVRSASEVAPGERV